MKLLVAAALAALLAGCTRSNPDAVLDGSSATDGPAVENGRPPGTIGGPCLFGDRCDPGLVCKGGICVPEVDGGRWDLGPLTDGPRADQAPLCDPIGFRSVVLGRDAPGDWTVVLEPQTKATTLTIANAKGKQAAAVFDYDVSGDQVAGFVVSRQSTHSSVAQEAGAAVQELTQRLGSNGTLSVRAQGAQIQTHDGFDAVARLTMDLTLGSARDIAQVRLPLVAGLLQVPTPDLSSAPAPFGATTSEVVIRLAVVLRKDNRALFVGAVTAAQNDADFSHLASTLSGDLASTNLLGQESATPGSLCDSQTVSAKPKNEVDIIWVMDESGSMDSKRAAIATGAATFFKQLQQTGLDFRMGVTNVCDPNGSFQYAVGKLCSQIAADSEDDGGTDRFLAPTEQAIFSSCINNPPGYEPAQEYGLVNAQAAIKRHLPRAQNSPSKIRTDAQVVVIVVTDEGPQGLKNVLPNTNLFKQCTLSAANQATVDAHVKPYIDYLSGSGTDPEAKVDYFQVIGGTCNSTLCSYQPDVAHGYNELAQALNGQVYDVCQSNLASAVSSIISGIVATATTFALKEVPVASSLLVSLDGVTLPRSNVSGYRHIAGTKELAFTGSASLKLGSTVVASYRLWQ